jgi:hypothetical protein
MNSLLQNLLNFPVFSRIRRNHALEHATLQILSKKKPHQAFGGYSDVHGLRILANVSTEDVHEAVEEALKRLREGEYSLAIHPRCGTNFVASGMLAGSAAWLASLGGGKSFRSRLDRLPIIMAIVTLVTILSQPLGPYLQQYITTDAHIGNLQVVEIMQHHRDKVSMFRILTRG